MADTLILHEIAVECRLGVYGWEQERPQPVEIDLTLAIDAAAAAQRDALEDALDYAALVQAVKSTAEGKAYHLMETLAEAVAACVLTSFRVPSVGVTVRKRSLPGIEYAAVMIERSNQRMR